jgi:hypothetical protein
MKSLPGRLKSEKAIERRSGGNGLNADEGAKFQDSTALLVGSGAG